MRSYAEIPPEWERDHGIVYYGNDDDEHLYEKEADQYIEYALDALSELPATIEIVAYRRMKPNHWDGESIIEHILEDIDQNFGVPDGEVFEATPNMVVAAEVLAKVIVEEYVPWACEAVETFQVDVQVWIKAHRPDWLEAKTP